MTYGCFVLICSVCSKEKLSCVLFVEFLGLSCVCANHHCVGDDFVEMRVDGRLDPFTVFLTQFVEYMFR